MNYQFHGIPNLLRPLTWYRWLTGLAAGAVWLGASLVLLFFWCWLAQSGRETKVAVDMTKQISDDESRPILRNRSPLTYFVRSVVH